MFKYLFHWILFLGFSLSATAQLFAPHTYPQGYFRNPQNIPIKLNANFGEMRPNHFHMGLDLATQQRENIPQVAVADGYVGKIKIEAGGFGNAIYLYHPNGYTSLYAHLNDFYPELQQWVIEQQYQAESWKIELEPPPHLFPVRKGQFIGYSGNTGGSQGPHLHFELRRTADESCLNPLLFDFNVYDVTPPDLHRLAIYDRNRSTYEQVPQTYALQRKAGAYTIPGSIVTVNSNRISFALFAIDRITGVPNTNGIFETVVYLDDKPVSGFQIDNISYKKTRYLNAHADYRIKTTGGPYYQHLTPLPGDRLGIYKNWSENGFVVLKDTELHNITVVVKDAHGNSSKINFSIRYSGHANPASGIQSDSRYMLPNQINVFEREDVQLMTSTLSLYDAIRFLYSAKTKAGAYSKVHVLHTPAIPVHDSISIRVRPSQEVPAGLEHKIIMVKAARGKLDVSQTKFLKGWFEARFREFGEFWLEADLTPPVIAVSGVSNGSVLGSGSRIVCSVSDNWKKIKNFRAELDGNWLRFVQRGTTFVYTMDAHCAPGTHTLRLTVEDVAGNQTEKTIHFSRR